MFGIGFEDFGGGLDFLVIAGESLLDEFDDVVGSGVDKLRCVDLHDINVEV